MEFFYNPQTKESRWNQPPEEDRISDIEELSLLLEKFGGQVQTLVDYKGTDRPHAESRKPANPRPSQEERWGGGEAVDVEESDGFHMGVTFAPGEMKAPRAPRPPGEMPWRIFLRGSQSLILVWFLGFLWVCRAVHVGLAPVEPPFNSSSVLETEIMEVAWPHSMFQPTGLACHPSLSTVLVSEKYAVFELDPNTLKSRPILNECLTDEPNFLEGGIRTMSVDCSNSECVAVLVGAPGFGLLRCPLSGSSAPERLTVYGGPWESFAAVEGSLWASSEDSVVRLERRPASPHELVPSRAVASTRPAGAGLLTFSSVGRLDVWSLEGRALASWNLPRHQQWVGACSTGAASYMIGRSKMGAFTMWTSSPLLTG